MKLNQIKPNHLIRIFINLIYVNFLIFQLFINFVFRYEAYITKYIFLRLYFQRNTIKLITSEKHIISQDILMTIELNSDEKFKDLIKN